MNLISFAKVLCKTMSVWATCHAWKVALHTAFLVKKLKINLILGASVVIHLSPLLCISQHWGIESGVSIDLDVSIYWHLC